MDRHRLLQLRVVGADLHGVENTVDRLVSGYTEDRGTKHPLGVCVDHYTHHAQRLVLLYRTANPIHRARADQQFRSRGACLRQRQRQADAAERWVDVQRVAGDAVADASAGAVEQIGGDDLEIISGVWGKAPCRCNRRPWQYQIRW